MAYFFAKHQVFFFPLGQLLKLMGGIPLDRTVHHNFVELTEGTSFFGLAEQLEHHPWNGLRFWDLIQPFFMFIVGVAMWFSVKKRRGRGDTPSSITRHIVKRCLILLQSWVVF